MTLKKLHTDGRIKPHKTSKAELDELRGGVEVKLKDSKSTSISDDTRFTTAYGAALLLAKMALACAGYRMDSKRGGHHVTAFETLPLCVGATANTLGNYFEACRRKRNEIDYDRAYVASHSDADDIVDKAEELQTLVEDWITKNHSALAK
jgi:hypothetical protein